MFRRIKIASFGWSSSPRWLDSFRTAWPRKFRHDDPSKRGSYSPDYTASYRTILSSSAVLLCDIKSRVLWGNVYWTCFFYLTRHFMAAFILYLFMQRASQALVSPFGVLVCHIVCLMLNCFFHLTAPFVTMAASLNFLSRHLPHRGHFR